MNQYSSENIPYFLNNQFKSIPNKFDGIITGHSYNSINSLDISTNGKYLVTGDCASNIAVWNFQTGKLLYCLTHNGGFPLIGKSRSIIPSVQPVTVQIIPNTDFLLSECQNAFIWDLNTAILLNKYYYGCSTVILDPEGNLLTITLGLNNAILVFDCKPNESLDEHKLLHTLKGHTDDINDYKITPNNRLISCSSDNTIKIWNLKTGVLEKTIKKDHRWYHFLTGHSTRVSEVLVNFDGSLLVSHHYDSYSTENTLNTFNVWDINDDYKLINTFSGNQCFPQKSLISPNENILVTLYPSEIEIRDLMGKLVKTIKMEGYRENNMKWNWEANHLSISPNGKEIIVGCSDGTVKIWTL